VNLFGDTSPPLSPLWVQVNPGCNPKILEGGTLLIEGLDIIFKPLQAHKQASAAAVPGPVEEIIPDRLVQVEELQTHNREGDVWMAIGGAVYDFTAFAAGEHGGHPGGKGVLTAYAGADGTAEWDFIGHSTYATRIRDKYCIGRLDMSSNSARMRQALGGERVSRLTPVQESLRDTVKTDTGSWNIANSVERKRDETPGSFQKSFAAFRQRVGVKSKKEWTMAEVGQHSQEDDCWIVIEGKVLDVTAFMMKHPGGKKSLMSMAGKDATKQFENLHEASVLEAYAGDLFVGNVKAEKAAGAAVKPSPQAVSPNLTAANSAEFSAASHKRASKLLAHLVTKK